MSTIKSRRGFAGMDPEKQRKIASMGGKIAHKIGTAHKFTPEEALIAGRKGGFACAENRRREMELAKNENRT